MTAMVATTARADVIVSDEIDTDAPVIVDGIEFASSPRLASDGTSYYAIWGEGLTDGSWAIVGARVGSDGVMIDPEAVQIGRVPMSGGNIYDVSFDGTQWVIVWGDRGDSILNAARVSAAGVVLDDPPLLIGETDTGFIAPSIASNGSGSLVVWPAPDGVRAMRLAADGTQLDPLGFLIAGPAQRVAVASDGTNYLVVTPGSAVRVDPAGTILDTPPIPIPTYSDDAVAVAWGGGEYLVVAGGAQCKAVRIDSAGQLLDPTPIPIGSSLSAPSLAFRNGSFLLSYLDMGPMAFEEPHTIVLDANAAIVSGPSSFVGSPALGKSLSPLVDMPSVAATATGSLGAWRSAPASQYLQPLAVMVRVSDLGTAVGSVAVLSRETNQQAVPVVNGHDGEYLFAWSDVRDYPVAHAKVERIQDGSKGPAVPIADAYAAALAWGGSGYVVLTGTIQGERRLLRLNVEGGVLSDTLLPPGSFRRGSERRSRGHLGRVAGSIGRISTEHRSRGVRRNLDGHSHRSVVVHDDRAARGGDTSRQRHRDRVVRCCGRLRDPHRRDPRVRSACADRRPAPIRASRDRLRQSGLSARVGRPGDARGRGRDLVSGRGARPDAGRVDHDALQFGARVDLRRHALRARGIDDHAHRGPLARSRRRGSRFGIRAVGGTKPIVHPRKRRDGTVSHRLRAQQSLSIPACPCTGDPGTRGT